MCMLLVNLSNKRHHTTFSLFKNKTRLGLYVLLTENLAFLLSSLLEINLLIPGLVCFSELFDYGSLQCKKRLKNTLLRSCLLFTVCILHIKTTSYKMILQQKDAEKYRPTK